jgi:hypothetical protein
MLFKDFSFATATRLFAKNTSRNHSLNICSNRSRSNLNLHRTASKKRKYLHNLEKQDYYFVLLYIDHPYVSASCKSASSSIV